MSPMTNISKCLAVLATVASLAYLGVVSVSVVGGPNYDANFDDPNLSDVKLTKKVDEETGKANYHVEARRPQRKDLNIPAGKGQEEASPFKADFENDSKVLPQIVITAREFVKKMQIRKEKILTASILLRTDQIKETRRLIAIDERAMKQRMKQIDAEIEAVQKRLIEKLNAANKLSTDAIALREKAVRRRNELKRLRGQVDELLADRFRLDIQQKKLGVLQIRLKGIILRLAGRGQRLQDQGATLNP